MGNKISTTSIHQLFEVIYSQLSQEMITMASEISNIATVQQIKCFLANQNVKNSAELVSTYEKGSDTWYYIVKVKDEGQFFSFAIHYHPRHNANWLHAKRSENQLPQTEIVINKGTIWYDWLFSKSQKFRDNESKFN
jgi:hypothetical protein